MPTGLSNSAIGERDDAGRFHGHGRAVFVDGAIYEGDFMVTLFCLGK
jgi:hypothetical protein